MSYASALKILRTEDELSNREIERKEESRQIVALQEKRKQEQERDVIAEGLHDHKSYHQVSMFYILHGFGDLAIKELSKFKSDHWRVTRWFPVPKIVIDTFETQELYDKASVEVRRGIFRLFGYKYAALGPMQDIHPHKDPALRKKYKSRDEQLYG